MDFLLSKASEYSSFISNDLDELQASMTESAKKAERKKKRKAEKEGQNGKPAKKTKPEVTTTGSGNPIFVQPTNLAQGCVLKDYQLEGVRWLASLYENGVSGILADGTCVSFFYRCE